MTFDPETAKRLVAEAREDREHLDVGDWIWVVRKLLKPMTAQLDAALAEVEYLREALGACDREALSAITRLTRERDEAVIERDNIEARIVTAIDKAWSEPGDAPSDLSAEVARVVRTVRIAVHEKRQLTEQRDEARAELARIRPVYEAAKAWREAWGHGIDEDDRKLAAAIDAAVRAEGA